MRPFWRSFWASIFAYVVLSAFIILIINIVVFTVTSSFMSSEEFKISENSYLEMDLNFNIKERGGIETTNDINNPISKSFGVNDVISVLKKAEKDEKIKGILLKISNVDMGMSTIDNLRKSLSCVYCRRAPKGSTYKMFLFPSRKFLLG